MSMELIENIFIELNQFGVVAVHGEIGDTAFVNQISPAIMQLDESIHKLRPFISGEGSNSGRGTERW